MVRANFRFQFSSLHFMLVSDPVNHTYLFFFHCQFLVLTSLLRTKYFFLINLEAAARSCHIKKMFLKIS